LAFSKIYILDNGRFAFFKEDMNLILNIDFVTNSLKEFQKRVNSSKINIAPIDYDSSLQN